MAKNWYNPIVRRVLRSPLHGVMSGQVLLITFTGRRSGREYTTPVNYTQHGDSLLLTTQRSRAWWRNLIGGAPVTLWLRGREYRATAEAQIDAATTAADLLAISRQVPAMQRHIGITLDDTGEPTDRAPLAGAAAQMITIRVTGLEPATEEARTWQAQQ